MAVVSCGSRRWCRAREPARYAATVSANCRRRSTRRAGGSPPPADLPAALHPRRAHRCGHAVPPSTHRCRWSAGPADRIDRHRQSRAGDGSTGRRRTPSRASHGQPDRHTPPSRCAGHTRRATAQKVCAAAGRRWSGRRRRARSLARDAQHADLDRQPARLGTHRPDRSRTSPSPALAADVAAAITAAGRAGSSPAASAAPTATRRRTPAAPCWT